MSYNGTSHVLNSKPAGRGHCQDIWIQGRLQWSLFLKTFEDMRSVSVIFSPKTRVKPQRSQIDQDRMDVGQGNISQCPQKGDLNPVKKGIPSYNQEEAQVWP